MRGFIEHVELKGLARRIMEVDEKDLLVVRADVDNNGSLAEGKYFVAECFGYSERKQEVSLTNPTDIVSCEKVSSQEIPFAAVEATYLVSPSASQSDLRFYFEQRMALKAKMAAPTVAPEEPAALSA